MTFVVSLICSRINLKVTIIPVNAELAFGPKEMFSGVLDN